MGGCVISLCQNTQESTGKLGQEPMSSTHKAVINLVLCFSLPTAFRVPCSVSLMESSNSISVPKGGKFQLIPGITNFLSLLPGAAPTSLGIPVLAPPIIVLWHEEQLCEPDGSLDRDLCWRVHYLPSQGGEVTRTSAPMSSVYRQPGLAALLFRFLPSASSPEAL